MSQVLSLIRERSFNRLQSYFPEAAQVLLAYARVMNISLVPVSKEQHSKVTSPCHVGNKLAADRRISVWLAQSTKDSATMALAASCWLCHLYTTNSGPRTAQHHNLFEQHSSILQRATLTDCEPVCSSSPRRSTRNFPVQVFARNNLLVPLRE